MNADRTWRAEDGNTAHGLDTAGDNGPVMSPANRKYKEMPLSNQIAQKAHVKGVQNLAFVLGQCLI